MLILNVSYTSKRLQESISKKVKTLEGKGFDPRKLLAPGFEAIKVIVKEKMELFGSINKA